MTDQVSTADGLGRPAGKGETALTVWERASFSVIHGAVAGLLAVSSLAWLYRIGRVFGTLEWVINYKRRGRFAAALQNVLGRRPAPSERRKHAREFFMRTRCDKLFYLIVDCVPRGEAAELLTVVNPHLLEWAIAQGNGVYVAMSHHGPQHLAAMLMALNGHKIAGVRDRREGGIRRYVQDRFDRRYPDFRRMRVLFADSYPRDLYRCFHERYLVGSAMDVDRLRDPRQKTEEVEVLGKKRLYLSGPLRVAIRCKAPVLQAFIIPEKNFRYTLDFVTVLVDPTEAGNDEAAVSRAMGVYAANVEKYLKEMPSLMTRL